MPKPILLHVEDDPDDREMVKEVVMITEYDLNVVEARNGQEALDFLRSDAGIKNPPRLILLDLNMPVLNGRETLAILKADPELASIPVVVYTTSKSEPDERFCAKFGVEMITKPTTYKEIQQILKWIIDTKIRHLEGL